MAGRSSDDIMTRSGLMTAWLLGCRGLHCPCVTATNPRVYIYLVIAIFSCLKVMRWENSRMRTKWEHFPKNKQNDRAHEGRSEKTGGRKSGVLRQIPSRWRCSDDQVFDLLILMSHLQRLE